MTMHSYFRAHILMIPIITVWFVFCSTTPSVPAFDDPPSAMSDQGIYVEMGAGNDPDTVGGEFGVFGYPNDHVSFRGGIACLASESFDDFFVGATTGFRLHLFSPETVVTPFVGLGVFGGYSKEQVPAEDDNVDNDDDGEVDEPGEEDDVIDDVIATIFPEAGVQVWVTDTSRLTLSGKYNLTTEGRDSDFWVFNLGMAWLF